MQLLKNNDKFDCRYVGMGSKALQACGFSVSQVLELLRIVVGGKVKLDDTAVYASMVLSSLIENEYLARQLDVKLMEWLVAALTKCVSLLSEHICGCKKMQSNAKFSVMLLCSIVSATMR